MVRAGAIYKATTAPMIDSRLEGLTSVLAIACHPQWTRVVSEVRRGARFAAMKSALLSALAFAGLVACQQRTAADLTAGEQKAIADSLKKMVVNAYDLSKPDAVK